MDQNQFNYQNNQSFQQAPASKAPVLTLKASCAFCYLGFFGLVLVGLLGDYNHPLVKHNLNQGIGLMLVQTYCLFVPVVGYICALVCLVFAIIGLVNALMLEQKDLPLISTWKFIN